MRKSTRSQWFIRVIIYICGLFCLAMGVAVSINSDLGVSPVNSLPYIISRISGRALSSCVIAVFCSYIALQAVLLRKEFRPINLLQIVFSTIFGYFTDFAKWLVGDWAIEGYGGRLVMLAISILFIAVGVLLYVEVKMAPMPMEGLTLAISARTDKPFPQVKTIVDCLAVAAGIALSVLFLGELEGIREGTVITAVVTGKMIALLKKPLSPIVQRLCFGEGEQEPLQGGG